MLSNKIKKYIIESLNASEEYIYKVFTYLKELEEKNPDDKKLQAEIWNLCEADELVSNVIVSLECLDDK
jgi:hypothetical protein